MHNFQSQTDYDCVHVRPLLVLSCHCVCPVGPAGRPATQADGAFPVNNQSIYLTVYLSIYLSIFLPSQH